MAMSAPQCGLGCPSAPRSTPSAPRSTPSAVRPRPRPSPSPAGNPFGGAARLGNWRAVEAAFGGESNGPARGRSASRRRLLPDRDGALNAEPFFEFVGLNLRDPRLSLLLAIASQAARQSEKAVQSFSSEASKYLFPSMNGSGDLQEALMTVPDLETIPSRVLQKRSGYEIREIDAFMIAETEMSGPSGFDFFSSSQAFNALADYLFGKNKGREEMEMTTPVLTTQRGESMEMTTPVLSQQKADGKPWTMSFVLPSKYGENLPVPLDDSPVTITKVEPKKVAVIAFPGIMSDGEAKKQETKLRELVAEDGLVRIKPGALAMIAQYNPPFTPPFARRNEVLLELEDEEEGVESPPV